MDYPGYVPGPAQPMVPLHVDYFTLVQVPATAGLPVMTLMTANLPIPGTVMQFAPVVLGFGAAAYGRGIQ